MFCAEDQAIGKRTGYRCRRSGFWFPGCSNRHSVTTTALLAWLAHSSINDKNAVQAKHIRKVGLSLLRGFPLSTNSPTFLMCWHCPKCYKWNKNTAREDQTDERFNEAQGRNEGEGKIVFTNLNYLRSWSALFPRLLNYMLESIWWYWRYGLGEKWLYT